MKQIIKTRAQWRGIVLDSWRQTMQDVNRNWDIVMNNDDIFGKECKAFECGNIILGGCK